MQVIIDANVPVPICVAMPFHNCKAYVRVACMHMEQTAARGMNALPTQCHLDSSGNDCGVQDAQALFMSDMSFSALANKVPAPQNIACSHCCAVTDAHLLSGRSTPLTWQSVCCAGHASAVCISDIRASAMADKAQQNTAC